MDFYKLINNSTGDAAWVTTDGNLRTRPGVCALGPRTDPQIPYDLYVKPWVDAISAPTLGLTVGPQDDNWKNVTTWSNDPTVNIARYFGNMATDLSGVMPPRSRVMTWKKRNDQSYKRWVQRVDSGEIVFLDYTVGNNTIVEYPDFQKKDIIARREFRYPRWAAPGLMPRVQPPCAIGTEMGWTEVPGGYIRKGLMQSPNGSSFVSVYERQTIKTGASQYYPSDSDRTLLPAIEAFLTDLTRIRPRQGVVTSVMCDANSGAWDVYTSVMENIRETGPMLLSVCKRILELYQSARGKVRHRRSLSSGNVQADIAQIWLQYRYAIKPLVYELNDILAYLDLQSKTYESFRGGKQHEVVFSHNGWTGSIDVIDRCLVRNLLDFSWFRGLQMNSLNTAWQLAPLSLVVDWVFNVGDVLTALKAPDNLASQKITYSHSCKGLLTIMHPDHPGRVVVDVKQYARGFPKNGSYVGLSFDPGLSFKQSIDAWAIFWAGVKNPIRYR